MSHRPLTRPHPRTILPTTLSRTLRMRPEDHPDQEDPNPLTLGPALRTASDAEILDEMKRRGDLTLCGIYREEGGDFWSLSLSGQGDFLGVLHALLRSSDEPDEDSRPQ